MPGPRLASPSWPLEATDGNVTDDARDQAIAINPLNPLPDKTRFTDPTTQDWQIYCQRRQHCQHRPEDGDTYGPPLSARVSTLD